MESMIERDALLSFVGAARQRKRQGAPKNWMEQVEFMRIGGRVITTQFTR